MFDYNDEKMEFEHNNRNFRGKVERWDRIVKWLADFRWGGNPIFTHTDTKEKIIFGNPAAFPSSTKWSK